MIRTAVLVVHITCGTLGLIVGPLAMRARKGPGRHPQLGRWYQGLTAGLCASAIGLVWFRPEVWPLAIVAVLTEVAALLGWRARRRQQHDWLRHHISWMCGSYVSFVTAFLVVQNQDELWPWIVPTIIATPWITVVALRHRAPSPAPAAHQ